MKRKKKMMYFRKKQCRLSLTCMKMITRIKGRMVVIIKMVAGRCPLGSMRR